MMIKRFLIGALGASLLVGCALGVAGLLFFTGMFLQTVLGVPEPWCILLGTVIPIVLLGGLTYATVGD